MADELREAMLRVLAGDPAIWEIVWLSLRVSGTAILAAALVGIPFGAWVGLTPFRGRRVVELGLEATFGLPTVLVGLILYAMLSRRGPLGALGLLYSPAAMAIGQFVLATPLVAALAMAGVRGLDERVWMTAKTIGAGRWRTILLVCGHARFALAAALLAAFGRILSEVGSAMMLGGNIRGETRTLTTAIALETARGDFGTGIALGLVLLFLSLAVAIAAGVVKVIHARRA
jgi:tungstate transport system permease protein